MGRTMIRMSGLAKRFGEVTALDGIDVAVEEGEVFGLLGPNGAGKTTTVKILITLVRPDAGSAEVAGFDVLAAPDEVRRRIGYVPQELTADPYLTARENLRYFADLYHIPPGRREARIEELLALVDLQGDADRPIRRFSGGMKKKLDLACGLLHEPPVLLLDEPSLGLDVQVRRDVWDHIAGLKGRGATIFLCTNYMDEAERLCDRVAIIDRGRIAASGRPTDLRAGLGSDVVTVEPAEEGVGGQPPLDRLETALRGLDFVKGSQRDGGRLRITVTANETAVPRVLEAAARVGVQIQAIAYSRPGLDDVFLAHTGRRFEEAHGTPGPRRHTR